MARTSANAGLPRVGAARAALVILALGLALAACGRRGALEPPPVPGAEKQATEDNAGDSVVASPVPGGVKKRPKGITIPDKAFFLDPLL